MEKLQDESLLCQKSVSGQDMMTRQRQGKDKAKTTQKDKHKARRIQDKTFLSEVSAAVSVPVSRAFKEESP
jgi:hypothetical protein